MDENVKSPFLVYQNFISPLLCEQIIGAVEFYSPETDKEGNPIKSVRRDEEVEKIIFQKFMDLVVPDIEKHFEVKYRGTEPIFIEYYPENSQGTIGCENSMFLRKKWVKTKDRDFTGVLFLNDYQDITPFDSDFEVYGGKLEFPQWGFGFNPQRGTLVVFPSYPHFVNVTTKILLGELYQAKIHIATEVPFLFDPKKFPGDYRSWFKGIT